MDLRNGLQKARKVHLPYSGDVDDLSEAIRTKFGLPAKDDLVVRVPDVPLPDGTDPKDVNPTEFKRVLDSPEAQLGEVLKPDIAGAKGKYRVYVELAKEDAGTTGEMARQLESLALSQKKILLFLERDRNSLALSSLNAPAFDRNVGSRFNMQSHPKVAPISRNTSFNWTGGGEERKTGHFCDHLRIVLKDLGALQLLDIHSRDSSLDTEFNDVTIRGKTDLVLTAWNGEYDGTNPVSEIVGQAKFIFELKPTEKIEEQHIHQKTIGELLCANRKSMYQVDACLTNGFTWKFYSLVLPSTISMMEFSCWDGAAQHIKKRLPELGLSSFRTLPPQT